MRFQPTQLGAVHGCVELILIPHGNEIRFYAVSWKDEGRKRGPVAKTMLEVEINMKMTIGSGKPSERNGVSKANKIDARKEIKSGAASPSQTERLRSSNMRVSPNS